MLNTVVRKAQDWQPTAMINTLRARAKLLTKIRQFFKARDVTEVDSPILAHAPVTDPYLTALTTKDNHGNTLYLQTSPEYAMKRLLCAGSGSIYQLGKVFRQDEAGRLHNIEFTLLEWYRVGFDDVQLMGDIDALLQLILKCEPSDRLSYQQIFEQHFNINPHTCDHKNLTMLCKQYCGDIQGLLNPKADDLLNHLFSTIIEPHLGKQRPCIIYDYPASQAALARLKTVNNIEVAARFELFYQGIELANGYHELQDAAEQRKRFENDLAIRAQVVGLNPVPIDEKFMQAMQFGLPDCAGVALGVDRLIMLALNEKSIYRVMCL